MRLSELADALEGLEKMRSRSRMAEHVADLLAHCARDERAYDTLLDVARTSGDDSLQRKISQVADLLHVVVSVAFGGGERSLARIGPRLGVPVRPALAQRLPSAAAIIRRLGAVQAEPKYDGFRLQMHRDGERVWAFSRRLENVTEMFPDLTAALRRQLRTKRAIVEDVQAAAQIAVPTAATRRNQGLANTSGARQTPGQ
jgi:ATP-dependent DNA ligase